MTHPLDGKTVRVLANLQYMGPPLVTLHAGTLAIARAARDIPSDKGELYWLEPLGNWPHHLWKYSSDIGFLVTAENIETLDIRNAMV